MSKKKIAVILCGSGYKDGSEIRESVSVLLALDQQGASFQCFAPDREQFDVINCLTGEARPGERRNMLVEAARIARGQVRPIEELRPEDFDGIILPGGFGAAKNLCTFAREGSSGLVIPELSKVLHQFFSLKKPIGAVCIAPAIVALAFKGKGFQLTVGEQSETSLEIEKMGHTHKVCPVDLSVVDRNNKIVTTPAYMTEKATLAGIFKGIENLVQEVLSFE
jgi:enhancing lycopene biosynthesis protein 2